MERLTPKDCNDLLINRSLIISDNIRKLRRKSGLNIETLAYLCNISVSVIVYAERGTNRYNKVYTPDINTLDRIAKILNVSIIDLMAKRAT